MRWGKIISFTVTGAQLAHQIASAFPQYQFECYCRNVDISLRETSLRRMVQQAMVDCQVIIFIGATGIAVRSIAPYLQGKAYDPAVLVLDEQGAFVIPLLSGHLGGANEFAVQLANILGAQPVLTTATDIHGVFSVDTWAKHHRCLVVEPHFIRYLSAACLKGEKIGLQTDFCYQTLPNEITTEQVESGFTVALHTTDQPFLHTLHLLPNIVHLGIGCRKDTSVQTIERVVTQILAQYQVDFRCICAVASIDIKRKEPGLLAFCRIHALAFHTYSAQELASISGSFTSSSFVKQTVGVDNVCERAAVKSTNGGTLICPKISAEGVTVALAVEQWELTF